MRDTKKVMRTVVYQALNGAVNVGGVIPVYDEKRPDNSTADVYILFSTQQETNENSCDAFMTRSFLDIEVVQNTVAAVTKDKIDEISNAILTILFPTPTTDGIGTSSNMQISEFRFERSISRTIEISESETIIRNIITISALCVQQF